MNFVPTATSLFTKLSIAAQVAGNDSTKSVHYSDSDTRLSTLSSHVPQPARSTVQSSTEAGSRNPAAVSSVSYHLALAVVARALTRTLRLSLLST